MNRPYLPPFFTLYDLPADSDERTLKRTYARELKKIDQATELEAFQALRDSYEQALEWLRNGASDAQMFVQDAVVTPLSDDPPETTKTAPAAIGTAGDEAAPSDDSDTPSFDVFRRANSVPVTQGNAAFTQRDPEILARLAFEAVMTAVTGTQASEETIDAALSAQMENPDMLNMDARFMFETAIARYLLDGWAPGKDWLFQSAVRHFEWLNHRERLNIASKRAHILVRAVLEWNEFQQQSLSVRQQYYEILTLAINSRELQIRELSDKIPLIYKMKNSYGNLLEIISQPDVFRTHFINTPLLTFRAMC